jgi:hypothetical protein
VLEALTVHVELEKDLYELAKRAKGMGMIRGCVKVGCAPGGACGR